MRQQLVDKYGPSKAFFGGLKVKSTLNLRLQGAAEEAVNEYLGYLPPTASVVVLDDHNAGVKAMVGGPNFETKPFNLATLGHRQPGSSIKTFTLMTALEEDLAYTTYESAPQESSTTASTARKPSSSATTRTPTSAPATSSVRRPTPTTRSTPSSASRR